MQDGRTLHTHSTSGSDGELMSQLLFKLIRQSLSLTQESRVQDKLIIKFRCKDPSQDISELDTANIIKFSKISQMVMKHKYFSSNIRRGSSYTVFKKRERKACQ